MNTFIIFNLRAAVTVVAFLKAVIEQAQVFLHFLGLIHGVRIQNLEITNDGEEENDTAT